jgi:3-(3-hydroxy-phenyl)propionate hydroxylase
MTAETNILKSPAPPIVIIGGGPVGLMLANVLGRRGVPVVLLEKRSGHYTLPRAICYDAETLRLFELIGLYDQLEPALLLDLPVLYYDANGKIFLQMFRKDRPYGHSSTGSFYQPDLEATLVSGLAELPAVDLRFNSEVSGFSQDSDGVDVFIKTNDGHESQLRASYVIACDGGSSVIRGKLGIGFDGATFDEKWLVVDTIDTGYDPRRVEFFCDQARPALTLPMANNRRRWEFLMMPGDTITELESEPRIRSLIKQYAPHDQSRIERSLVYTFHARLADTYRKGRVLLAGDSAHVMPPFAGQGMNSGIRDAANLAWKLEWVWRGLAKDNLLDTYEQERREHVRAMTNLAIKLGKWMMPKNSFMAGVRNFVFALTDLIPGRQENIDKGALVPPAILPKGCALGPIVRGKISGHLLLQPDVVDARGVRQKLDHLLGTGFSLIGLGVDPLAHLHPADRDLITFLDTRCVQIGGVGADAEDVDHVLTHWTGAGERLLFVRPDKYVAADFAPDSSTQKLAAFAAAFQPKTIQ